MSRYNDNIIKVGSFVKILGKQPIKNPDEDLFYNPNMNAYVGKIYQVIRVYTFNKNCFQLDKTKDWAWHNDWLELINE